MYLISAREAIALSRNTISIMFFYFYFAETGILTNAEPLLSKHPSSSMTISTIIKALAKKEGWMALAYDGRAQLFAPSQLIPAAHREGGVVFSVPRPADLPGKRSG